MLPQKTDLRQFYFVYPSLEILSGLLQIYLMTLFLRKKTEHSIGITQTEAFSIGQKVTE